MEVGDFRGSTKLSSLYYWCSILLTFDIVDVQHYWRSTLLYIFRCYCLSMILDDMIWYDMIWYCSDCGAVIIGTHTAEKSRGKQHASCTSDRRLIKYCTGVTERIRALCSVLFWVTDVRILCSHGSLTVKNGVTEDYSSWTFPCFLSRTFVLNPPAYYHCSRRFRCSLVLYSSSVLPFVIRWWFIADVRVALGRCLNDLCAFNDSSNIKL